MNSAEFFIKQAAAHGRTLPVRDSVEFFRGMLLLCGDQKEVAPIREMFLLLNESDAQLELIAGGQIKLDFPKERKAR